MKKKHGGNYREQAVYSFAVFFQDSVYGCKDKSRLHECKGGIQEGFGLECCRKDGISEDASAAQKFAGNSKQDYHSPQTKADSRRSSPYSLSVFPESACFPQRSPTIKTMIHSSVVRTVPRTAKPARKAEAQTEPEAM